MQEVRPSAPVKKLIRWIVRKALNWGLQGQGWQPLILMNFRLRMKPFKGSAAYSCAKNLLNVKRTR